MKTREKEEDKQRQQHTTIHNNKYHSRPTLHKSTNHQQKINMRHAQKHCFLRTAHDRLPSPPLPLPPPQPPLPPALPPHPAHYPHACNHLSLDAAAATVLLLSLCGSSRRRWWRELLSCLRPLGRRLPLVLPLHRALAHRHLLPEPVIRRGAFRQHPILELLFREPLCHLAWPRHKKTRFPTAKEMWGIIPGPFWTDSPLLQLGGHHKTHMDGGGSSQMQQEHSGAKGH